jgi:hypothetical protein
MNIEYTIDILPATPSSIAIKIVLPSIPSEQQIKRVLELVTPAVRLQRAGLGVRIRPDGATVEEAIKNIPSEIDELLSTLR